jgi:hypothetical protein
MEQPQGAAAPAVPAELSHAAAALGRLGQPADRVAWGLLSAIGDTPETAAPIQELKTAAQLGDESLERLLIWQAAREALPRVESLSVPPWVRTRMRDELLRYHDVKASLEVGSYGFTRAAKMATLRLFPAGPMDWEYSGIPRSWFLKPSFPQNLRLLGFLATRVRGFTHCMVLHVAPFPKNRALVMEKEVLKSYHRMARALELQPQLRAIFGRAWFFDPAAVRDHPHLQALNRPFVELGGTVAVMEPVPPDCGVLEGNLARRRNYLEGKLQYRYGFALWPRDAALKWAGAHPELAE